MPSEADHRLPRVDLEGRDGLVDATVLALPKELDRLRDDLFGRAAREQGVDATPLQIDELLEHQPLHDIALLGASRDQALVLLGGAGHFRDHNLGLNSRLGTALVAMARVLLLASPGSLPLGLVLLGRLDLSTLGLLSH